MCWSEEQDCAGDTPHVSQESDVGGEDRGSREMTENICSCWGKLLLWQGMERGGKTNRNNLHGIMEGMFLKSNAQYVFT